MQKTKTKTWIKQCAICGKEFSTSSNVAKYCSDECRKTVKNEREKRWKQEHKEYYREYAREWRAKNPERIKEYSHRHYLKHRETKLEYDRKYHQEHKEERREYRKYLSLKQKIQACSEAHDNCFACDTPDGECRFG